MSFLKGRVTVESKGVIDQRILSSSLCGVKRLCQILGPVAAKGRLFESVREFQDGHIPMAALANPVL